MNLKSYHGVRISLQDKSQAIHVCLLVSSAPNCSASFACWRLSESTPTTWNWILNSMKTPTEYATLQGWGRSGSATSLLARSTPFSACYSILEASFAEANYLSCGIKQESWIINHPSTNNLTRQSSPKSTSHIHTFPDLTPMPTIFPNAAEHSGR